MVEAVTKRRVWSVVFGVHLSLAAGSCSEQIEVGRDHPAASAGAGTGGAGLSTGGASAGATSHACQQTACQGKVYLCGDCVDNDGDQLKDSDDPECTGPCDNTEDSYYGGIPGQNNAPCRQDCYFDQDTGSGNDQCFWSHECDPQSVAPEYPPSGDSHCAYQPDANVPGSNSTCDDLQATQASVCLDTCLPITPNGCDCFGCCELPAASNHFVWIGSSAQNVGSCDTAHLADPSACHPCTPVPSCLNACDPCEVCVGRTSPSQDCGSTNSARCPASVAACGQPGEPACDAGFYCITGCCAAAPR
jgi:hypothetical protein